MVDGQSTNQRPNQADSLRDQSISEGLFERQLEYDAIDRRQPDGKAVIDEVGGKPNHPDDERSSQIRRGGTRLSARSKKQIQPDDKSHNRHREEKTPPSGTANVVEAADSQNKSDYRKYKDECV